MRYLKNFMILIGVFAAGIVAIILSWILIPMLIFGAIGLMGSIIINEQRNPHVNKKEVKYEIKPRPRPKE